MRAALACLGLVLLGAAVLLGLRGSEGRTGPAPARAVGAPGAASGPAREPLAPPAEVEATAPATGPRAAAAEAPAQTSNGSGRRDAATAEQEAPLGEGELRLRLLDAQLAVLPKTTVEIDAAWEDGRSSWISSSDAHARLRLVLPRERRPGLPHTLYLRGRDRHKGLSARLALLPGAADLGDVALQPEPALVSGVVLSPSALLSVRPWVEMRPVDAAGLARATLRAATAPDGSFEIRGWPEDAAWLELTAKGARTAGVRRRVTSGATGVVLQLEVGGVISGSVLLDHREHAERVSCALGSDAGDWMRLPLGSGGELMSGRLQPGRYSVRLMLEGHPLPLLALEGIEVANDAVVTPPELDPCDLRGRLRELVIEVRDDQGHEVPARSRFRASGAGQEAWSEDQRDRHQGVRLVAEAALDVEASLPGYHTAVQYRVESDATIWLQRARPIAICLGAAPSLPAGCRLKVRLQHADGRAAEAQWPVEFEGRCARLTTAAAGRYHAVIDLVRGPSIAIAMDLPEETLGTLVRTLDVLDVAQEQDFAVSLDQAWIDAGISKPARFTFGLR